MQCDPIHLYTLSNTIPTRLGSVGTWNQTSGVVPSEPGFSWPQPGQSAMPARDRVANTPGSLVISLSLQAMPVIGHSRVNVR